MNAKPDASSVIRSPLSHLFNPDSVAVFGASERPDSVGGLVFSNIVAGDFGGAVYPINPKHATVLGRRCYPSIEAIGQPVDLALIATPAPTVPEIIRRCGEHGVRAAIVYSAGFGESAAGKPLQDRLLDAAQRYRLRVLGPNCLGLIRPDANLNATFSRNAAAAGPLGLISQSGALCTAILDWAQPRHIGFSAMVSLGSAADIDFGDLLDYLALDPKTRAILLYIEGIRDARRFVSGLRAAARLKPVVVVKAGRHAEASRAALTHTGALVGADDVFDAALARAGAVRAQTIEQLFAAAQLLSVVPHGGGNRLGIITNAGGPAVLAVDRAADLGVAVAQPVEATIARLDAALPPQWSHSNPVDILGDAPPERYSAAVAACLEDPGIDGLLVILTPQGMTDPLRAAQAVAAARGKSLKPILACWMGDPQVAAARRFLVDHGIPEFESPETAVEAFGCLQTCSRNRQLSLQVPGSRVARKEPDVEDARRVIDSALADGRGLLTPGETRGLLTAFRIPLTPTQIVGGGDEAVAAAESIGFPVAMKIVSPDIPHKSDVNGVRLGISTSSEVRRVYDDLIESVRRQRPDARIAGISVERMYRHRHGRELHVGILRDAVFGPVISFGLGGITIEVVGDHAIALPPLNEAIADALVERTRAARLLGAFRHMPPADRDALRQVLLSVSEMACELPALREMDINPLVADPDGVLALDARVVVDREAGRLDRYGHMAIHPYPTHLVSHWRLDDGTELTIRPIRPEDARIEQTFVCTLSPQSRYFRFMESLQELTPQMLVRFTQIDYDREMALIATTTRDGEEVEIAVARYGTNPDGESCEFAIVVADEWQCRGLGTRLLSLLIDHARARGLRRMEGTVLADNAAMLALARKLGFTAAPGAPGDREVIQVTRWL
jgi:acetyltransferase